MLAACVEPNFCHPITSQCLIKHKHKADEESERDDAISELFNKRKKKKLLVVRVLLSSDDKT